MCTTKVKAHQRGATLIFALVVHCRDGPTSGWYHVIRVLLRSRKHWGSYTGPLIKFIPSDRAVLTGFLHTCNILPVSARVKPTTLDAMPLVHSSWLCTIVLQVSLE